MNEELKVIITAKIDDLREKIDEAKGKVSGFSEQVEKAKGDVNSKFSSMGESINKGLKVGAAAITAVGAALTSTAALTEEYRTSMAKLETAFTTAGASADQAKEVYNDLYRVLGDNDKATEAAAHLAKLTTNQQDLSEWTNICQGVYATFGDSLPIEGLTEAANETAKTGQLTGVLADALNWAGVNEDEFQAKLEACNTEQEREALIRDTLNGLYSDAAASYEETAADVLAQNEAQAKLTDTLAQLGEAMAPILTLFTQFATEALAVVTPYIQELAEKYGPLLKDALEKVAEIVGKIMGFIGEYWEIIAGIGAVIGGIAAAIGIYNAVAAVKAAMDAAQVTTLGALAAAYAAQAAAMIVAIAPYVLIVAAIAAVIAIIVVCIKHWDDIKEAVGKAVDKIKEVVGSMAEKVKEILGKLNEKVSEIWEKIKGAVSDKIEKIKSDATQKWESIKSTVTDKVEGAKKAVTEKFENIKNTIKDKVETAKKNVTEKFENIRSTISDKITAAKDAVGGALDKVKGFFSDKLKAAYDTVSGILGDIKDKFTDIMDSAKDIVSGAIDKIKGFFNFDWELPKLKLPHFTVTGKLDLFKIPPSIPKLSVEWYQKGGIFDSPTLFGYGNGMLGGLGENGAEAVVPLEKNTEWLDKIADRLATKDQRPVYLMVDKRVLGQSAGEGMSEIYAMTGKIPINLG